MPNQDLHEPILRLFDGFSHTAPDLKPMVRQLQMLLNARGLHVAEDGYFGRETERALWHFQAERELHTDGIAGPHTWAALRGRDAPDPDRCRKTKYPCDHTGLREELPLVKVYRAYIHKGAACAGVPPAVICGIGSRESRWGLALTPPGPAGTGDTIRRATRRPWRDGDLPPDGRSYGRGLLQIDFDAHEFARTGHWRDPAANIAYGCEVLRQNLVHLRQRTDLDGDALLRAALAAYNCGAGNVLKALKRGRDADYYTHNRNYARDVLQRAAWFQHQRVVG